MSSRASLLLASLSLAACAGESRSADRAGDGASATAVPSLPPSAGAPVGTGGIMAPPGDAEEAIRSEFATVEQRGTADAYAIFAERHPGHPLAREAARRAQGLKAQMPGPDKTSS